MTDPYDDPLIYDLEYADYAEDIAYYVARAHGRLLELGCGTGRLTLPMVHAGAEVVGVDCAPRMLDGLRAKLERESPRVRSRVALVCADYLAPELPDVGSTCFSTVMWPFNALHHCPDPDALALALQRIAGWLAPGGIVYLDGYLPDRSLYDRDPDALFEPRVFRHPVSGEEIESWEQGWWEEAARVQHVVHSYRWSDGTERHNHLRLRMFERFELHRLIERTGWRLLYEAEDFDGRPLSSRSLKWVAALVR